MEYNYFNNVERIEQLYCADQFDDGNYGLNNEI